MSEFETHQPHVLRAHRGEWCGGTEPPTIVAVKFGELESEVAIFQNEAAVHDGIVATPEYTQRYMHLGSPPVSIDDIARYAGNAIRQYRLDADTNQ